MSYPDIPRYATSRAVSFCWRTYRFENAAKRREQNRLWDKQNRHRGPDRRPSLISIESASTYRLEVEMILASEQKSPLELLMEKEEAGL